MFWATQVRSIFHPGALCGQANAIVNVSAMFQRTRLDIARRLWFAGTILVWAQAICIADDWIVLERPSSETVQHPSAPTAANRAAIEAGTKTKIQGVLV